MWCRKCAHYKLVKFVHIEFKLRCKGCRYVRHFGADERAANKAAADHSMKSGHKVEVDDGRGNVVEHAQERTFLASPSWFRNSARETGSGAIMDSLRRGTNGEGPVSSDAPF